MNSDDERPDGSNPYSTPQSGVQRESVGAPNASLLQRLGGSIVDNVLTWACVLGPPMMAGDMGGLSEALQSGDQEQVREAMLVANYTATPILLLVLGGFNLFLLYRDGQTIGKRMLGSRIVRTSGQRAGILRILFPRTFLPGMIYMMPAVGPLIAILGHAIILLNARRCMHDYLADTKVVAA